MDGIDVYGPNPLPSWDDLRAAGITFIIHKCTESNYQPDAQFPNRWTDTRANGIIRGAYHYYRHTDADSGDVQADLMVAALRRLGPGDLPPAMDFENSALAPAQHEPATAADWRQELEAFLDTVETRLGRSPIIYTSASAWGHLSGKRDYAANDVAHFGDYPLWVKSYTPRVFNGIDLDNPPNPLTPAFRNAATAAGDARYNVRETHNPLAANIPGPWVGRSWFIWQYTPFTPAAMMNSHGFTAYDIDFDVTHGGIHVLRAMADLGRTAPHRVGNLSFIAYANPDGSLHLLKFDAGAWQEEDLSTISDMPLAAGDPAAICGGNEQVIVYRATDDHIYAIARPVAGGAWSLSDITGGVAIGDPFITVLGNDVHVVYWDEYDNQVHMTLAGGTWSPENLKDSTGKVTSGSAVAYVHEGALHIVSRAGDDGHLIDLTASAGSAAPTDLSAGSTGAGAIPAATFRPAAYAASGQAPRIIFRALRGEIWQIERDSLNATNLTSATNAPVCIGNPSAVVASTIHIVYRSLDGTINEIFDDAGTWATRVVCPDAASDPTAYVDEAGNAAVSFRAINGAVQIARFDGSWNCVDAAPAPNP